MKNLYNITKLRFIVTIQPLTPGGMPRKALVTPCKTIGDLCTYRIKSLVGSAEVWKHDLDILIQSGEYKLLIK